MTTARALIVLLLLGATGAMTHASRNAPAAPPRALTALPFAIDAWHGADAAPLDAATLRELAADSYVNRTYASGAGAPVGLYIAYYARQRPNVSIHSPLHCLPGTGWEPLEVSTISIAQTGGPAAPVRRMIVRKNVERAIVLYWYAIHGRTIANELSSKLWLLHDSIRLGRTDAALVRVSVPIAESVDAAEREGVAFARALLPRVSF